MTVPDDQQRLTYLVDIPGVKALLIGRPSDIFDSPDRRALFERTLTGVCSEVASVTGEVPPERVRAMAVWCACLGIAASMESALYPEQQLGEDSRARELRTRFLGVMAALRTSMTPTNLSTGVDLAGSYSTSHTHGRALDVPWWP